MFTTDNKHPDERTSDLFMQFVIIMQHSIKRRHMKGLTEELKVGESLCFDDSLR